MRRIAAVRGALYMLSVQPREQEVAEKPYGEHLQTSLTSSSLRMHARWQEAVVGQIFKMASRNPILQQKYEVCHISRPKKIRD